MPEVRFVSLESVVAKIGRLLEEEGIRIHQTSSLFDIRPADVRVIGEPVEQGGRPRLLGSGDDYVGQHCVGWSASSGAAAKRVRNRTRTRLPTRALVRAGAPPR